MVSTALSTLKKLSYLAKVSNLLDFCRPRRELFVKNFLLFILNDCFFKLGFPIVIGGGRVLPHSRFLFLNMYSNLFTMSLMASRYCLLLI